MDGVDEATGSGGLPDEKDIECCRGLRYEWNMLKFLRTLPRDVPRLTCIRLLGVRHGQDTNFVNQ